MPLLWDAIRHQVDIRSKMGQFIITGSSEPLDWSQIKHSGVGRINSIILRPMTLWESKESSGYISLEDLFKNTYNKTPIENNVSLKDIAYYCTRGGWPQSVVINKPELSIKIARNYIDTLINNDAVTFNLKESNKNTWMKLLHSLARNTGTSATISTIYNDVVGEQGINLSRPTISKYLDILINKYIIESIPSFTTNLRSKAIIRNTDTRYFVDPSLAIASLGSNPEELLQDIKTFGFMFENLCARDLKVYADSIEAKIFHYRDNNNLEVDFIIKLPNGKFGFIESKIGTPESIELAAKNMIKLKEIIDIKGKYSKPEFMIVLTAANQYYQREDGVLVVPITMLKN